MEPYKSLKFNVLFAKQYYDALKERIDLAQERICIAAMVVRSGNQYTQKLLQSVANAATRGVKVLIVADVYSFSLASRALSVSRADFKKECAATKQMMDKIAKNGGRVVWLGRLGANPYAGRYHVKCTVIDNDVFSFGGINFYDQAFTAHDYMLRAQDSYFANVCADMIESNAAGKPAKNALIWQSGTHKIYYDAGLKKSSLIYDTACQLAEAAESIVYVSQTCPNGRLASILKSKLNFCYYNSPRELGFNPMGAAQLWDMWRSKIPNSYKGTVFIHAKCIFYNMPNKTQVVISGSHNFSQHGVALGTKEIALISTDPKLYKSLCSVVVPHK